MTTRTNYAYTFGFALLSIDPTGANVTASELRTAILAHLARLTDVELVENCGMPFDSFEDMEAPHD